VLNNFAYANKYVESINYLTLGDHCLRGTHIAENL